MKFGSFGSTRRDPRWEKQRGIRFGPEFSVLVWNALGVGVGVEVLLRVPTGQVEKIGVSRGEVDKRSDFELIWNPCFPFPRKRSNLLSLCLLDFCGHFGCPGQREEAIRYFILWRI